MRLIAVVACMLVACSDEPEYKCEPVPPGPDACAAYDDEEHEHDDLAFPVGCDVEVGNGHRCTCVDYLAATPVWACPR
ncbi:MAG: hypothetical protein HOV81_38035 [Kofleriaceae bacterium]|nr:hypothetical protein [Kofleriaceae bacterium]